MEESGGSEGEKRACSGDVGEDLAFQLIDISKLAFVAQPREELQLHPPAIEVAREVQQMSFNRQLGSSESRADTDI